MSLGNEIKTAIERQAEAFNEFVKTQDERFAKLSDRVEDIEAKGSRPGAVVSRQDSEHVDIFTKWVRRPRDHQTNEQLSNFQSAKSVTIATPADGGYAVPEEIGRQIEAKVLKLSPVRRIVKISRAGTSDIKRLVDLRGAEGGWRSETGTVTETGTPALREIAPTGGELYAYPKASNWSLDDVFFDVSGWLSDSVAEKFASLEGIAVLTGDGTNTLTGMLNSAPTSAADDAVSPRAAAVYQYINSGDNSPANVDGDALIDLVYTVNSAYRAGAVFAMNSATAGAVRKLKDSYGRYLWTDGLVLGQPASLLGYPVEIWEDMPDIGGGQHPVAFGNFSRAYELIDRSDLRITVDPFTTAGFTKYYVRKRVYGAPLNNDAVKFLKCL